MSGTINLFGIDINNISFQEVLDEIHSSIIEGSKHYVVTPNMHHIVRLQSDEEFKNAYSGASLVLPDGMPLIWASRILGRRLKERVAGADLVPALCKLAEENKYSIFILGARPEVASLAGDNLKKKYPGLIIAGVHHGYFTGEAAVLEAVNIASPDMLLIGMGSPKQELWIKRNLHLLNIKVALCIGGVLEILAGTRKRAPLWMQKKGLEWFYRFIQEPGRLWKRYFVGGLVFFMLLMKEMRNINTKKYRYKI